MWVWGLGVVYGPVLDSRWFETDSEQRIDMKATDHDLQQMFKTHQEHSVVAAFRAIYDAGIVKGMEIISGELSKPIVLGEVTLGEVSPVADLTTMANHLLAVAHMVDAGPHDNWR